MVRKFVPFDEGIIKRELRDLPTEDFLDLTQAMKLYQQDAEIGYTIDNYGDVMMIKGKKQGRGLFFAHFGDRLVLLKVYKKETQKVPRAVIESAISRKRTYMENQ